MTTGIDRGRLIALTGATGFLPDYTALPGDLLELLPKLRIGSGEGERSRFAQQMSDGTVNAIDGCGRGGGTSGSLQQVHQFLSVEISAIGGIS